MAASKEAIPWPPQTTQDVINLTPRRRRQQQQSSGQNEPPSPSPLRRSSRPSGLDGADDTDSTEFEGSEDEEMLKLQLERIEAKLRLKKLQKRARKTASSATMNGNFAGSSSNSNTSSQTQESPHKRLASSSKVLVPASPSSRSSAAQAAVQTSPKSPSRVLLGIDKGLTGRDISLAPPPQYRSGNRHSAVTTARAAARPPSSIRATKTFSERIAEQRNIERAKAERAQVVAQSRSKGFGLKVPERGDFSPTLSAAAAAAQKATQNFTNILARYDSNKTSTTLSSIPDPFTDTKDTHDEAGFDSFSGLHLSKRITPHTTVSRHLSQKHIFLFPHLLKTVVSPNYDPPDVEGDWITLGIIASKSEPRSVGQNTGKTNHNNAKYMVMQLTDLKWEIELFLFGGGFQRYWHLPVGTVIAILNPGVMKPRNIDSGRFSLTLADDAADAVLEIGFARDLAFCKSIKRDGKQCGAWIDRRHTSVCSFHVEQAVSKNRVSRPEINSVSRLFSPPRKGSNQRQPSRRFLSRGSAKSRDDGLLNEGPISDLPTRLGGAGGNVFIAPGRTTAQLIDNELEPHLRGTKEERLRQRLADAKKERDLTKRLIAAQGRDGGVGAQYLKTRHGLGSGDAMKSAAAMEEERKAAASKTAEILSSFSTSSTSRDVRLSPIKRKRTDTFSSLSQPTIPSTSSSFTQSQPTSTSFTSASTSSYHPHHARSPSLPSALAKRSSSFLHSSTGAGWGSGAKDAVNALLHRSRNIVSSSRSMRDMRGVGGGGGGGGRGEGRGEIVESARRRPMSSRASSFTEEPVKKKTRFALVIPGGDSDDDGLDIVMG
ncbi:hypothetical protein EX30DRAFT_361437 [Ascodesmis nigricans]|uniref:Uncharacterized protein n=1 Tax=Ascodesmis nigricans TaxID=341454 RepID=A0A4S2N8C1_9PEZI|nr:hypothetical protein EX30DRAFT_361437 [Ascodesmis nigricans]